jgi:phosphoserine aminotransferase
MTKPTNRPKNPNFSSGPCAKRPNWTIESLKDSLVGRSHRGKEGKQRLKDVIEKTRAVLGVPADYKIGILPASDTGAFECIMWTLLGARPVDVLAWESFSEGWVTDIVKQLKIPNVRTFTADYGKITDLSQVDTNNDIVFCWNGTTSGVCVPNGNWIAADRQGLTLCDATSAAFAMDLPWDKLDATTFSWQKVLGGEAQHGILILILGTKVLCLWNADHKIIIKQKSFLKCIILNTRRLRFKLIYHHPKPIRLQFYAFAMFTDGIRPGKLSMNKSLKQWMHTRLILFNMMKKSEKHHLKTTIHMI